MIISSVPSFKSYPCSAEVISPMVPLWKTFTIGGSEGSARDARPLWVHILSFSCSFWGKLDKIIAWDPHLEGWQPSPRLGNPPLNHYE